MLKKALRYIRQKPKAVRNQYALALSVAFTALVVFVWLVSGTSSLDKSGKATTEGSTPFSNLIKQAKDQFASSKEALTKAEQATLVASTTSSSSTSGEMILSAETLDGIEPSNWSASTSASTTNFGFPGSNEPTSTKPVQYIEVQIVTTTTASTAPATSPQ